MRKILLIAYHFPPLTTSGMYRSFEFVRFLPEFGWEPIVVTVRPETLRDPGLLDPEPLGALRPGTRVDRTAAYEPLHAALRLRDRLAGKGREERAGSPAASAGTLEPPGWRDWITDFLSVPDRQIGWIPPAAAAAVRIIEEEDIRVIYSSSPPASAHLAARIAARFTGKPWIADFRDPWVTNPFAPPRRTAFLEPVDQSMERCVVGDADRIVVNTEEMRLDFIERYGDLARKFSTIPNGFDPEERIPEPAGNGGGHPFTITHAGSLYGLRDPEPILRAVQGILRRGEARPEDIRVRFLGSAAGEEKWKNLLATPPLSEVVVFDSKVPRSAALRALAASDLLLLIQTGTDLQVPRKLYDYLAVGRPILALVTGGATESLLRAEKLAWIVHPDEQAKIESRLLSAMRGETGSFARRPGRFDFRNLTGELAEILKELET
jgi:glycosyltransferase involved in cell wall biosynthesis